jgi:flagellar protein FlaG
MDGSVGLISTQVSSMPVFRPTTTGPQASKQQTEAAKPAAKTEDKNTQDEQGRTANAVTVANTLSEFLDKKISFAYDERINQIIVKVIRESTQEVIRQMPPEEMVELMARLHKDFRGLICNQTS